MSKKLLSVLLAVLVLAVALPLGFAMAEDPTYTIDITDSKLINGFPATDDKDNSPGMSAVDGIKYYVAASNITVEYVEGTNGVKLSSAGSMTDINIRLKDTSFAGANMISLYVDATGAAGEEGFLYVRPCFNYASSKFGGADVARYFAAGHSYYFLEDGATEAIKVDVAKNASVWNARVSLFAGKKGTYFFPEECFAEYDEAVTGYESGNTVTLPTGAWTSFGDDHLVNSANAWVMDKNNYGQANFSFQQFWFPAGDSIIIDDLKYVQATVTENEGGPVANPNVPTVAGVDETAEGANDGKITGVDTTMEYRAEADDAYTAVTGTEITGLAPGKYFVRFAATAEYLASADAEVVIAAGAPVDGGEGEEPVVAPTYNKEVVAEDFSAFELNHNWTAEWGTFCIYSNNPDGAVTANQVALTDGRFTITPASTAIDGTRFTTELYNIGNWAAEYEALSFHLDTTGLNDSITLRPKFVGIMFEGNARTTIHVCANDIYYVADNGTVTKDSFAVVPGEDASLYQWDIPADFKGTVIIPRNALACENAVLNATYDKFAFQFEFLTWKAEDNGESVSIDDIKYLYNVSEGGEGGGEGEGEEPVVAPEFDSEAVAEDFSAFELNHNWTAQWGTFCIYSNNPDGAVTANQVALTDGRFTITPASTATDGTRFTTEIYDIGDWLEKYEAFAFDLDATGLTDGITLRPKFVGIYFEGGRTTFNVCAGDIYFVAEDGTVTKETFEAKPGEEASLYQWDIPADFKGTVIIPRDSVVAEDVALHADYDKFAFQFEFLSWHAADNGESISVDNFKYLYNGIALDWADPDASLAEDTIDYGENLDLTVNVVDDEGTELTVIWTFDEGDTIYYSNAVTAVDGITTINVDVDATVLAPGTYEMWVIVVAGFNMNTMGADDAVPEYVALNVTVEEVTVLGDLTIELEQTEYDYDGTAKEPAVTVKKDGQVVDASEYVVTYTNNVDAGTATVTITDAEGGEYAVETTVAEFTIKPVANENVPTVGGQGETVMGNSDGIITGVDETMEYRAEGETTYTAVTGNKITGLAPGKYYVRYAASGNYNASAEVEIVIAAGQAAPAPDMGVMDYTMIALAVLAVAGVALVLTARKRKED